MFRRVLFLPAAIAIPNLLASRRAANEASAISGLRTVGSAESTYSSTLGSGAYTDLATLATNQLIDTSISGATSASPKSGYFYGTQNAGAAGFQSAAARVSDNTGTRNFSSHQAGVIYGMTSAAGRLDYATPGGNAIGN